MYDNIYRRFKGAAFVMLMILFTGTTGFYFIGEMKHNVVDCLYMTVITILTIGFREVIDIQGNAFAQLFTIFIAFSGIGTTTFIFSNITALIVEGEIKKTFKGKKMEKLVKDLKGHYIICGAGRVGTHILKELHTTGRNTVVIDNDDSIIEEVNKKYANIPYIKGDADVEDVLVKAGVREAAGIFAATGDDNQNLVICLTAKYMNPGIRVVVRCLDAANFNKLKKAGADSVILENFIAGMRMASEMIRPTVVNFLDKMLADRDRNLRVEEFRLGESYYNKSLEELKLENFPGTLLLAVVSGEEWTYNPKASHVVKKDTRIVVITTPEERDKLVSHFGN